MICITGRYPDNTFRAIDDEDMSVLKLSMDAVDKLGDKAKITTNLDSWYSLYLLLVDHYMKYGMSNTGHNDTVNLNEFLTIKSHLIDISKCFSQFTVPNEIDTVDFMKFNDGYVIVVNNEFFYLLNSKVCKLFYHGKPFNYLVQNKNFPVPDSPDQCFTFFLKTDRPSGERIIDVDDYGRLHEWSFSTT